MASPVQQSILDTERLTVELRANAAQLAGEGTTASRFYADSFMRLAAIVDEAVCDELATDRVGLC